MDLKQLRALVTVAEVGSVTQAARLLNLVQPAVTRQIRALESELATDLFERRHHGMILTPAGRILVDQARRALRELDVAVAQIRPDMENLSGVVSVGILESLMDLIPDALALSVRQKYPGIELRVLTGYSGYLRQWLDAGELDIALLYDLSESRSMAALSLVEESLWAVAPRAAQLRPDRPVTWAELFAHPVVLPLAGHGLRSLIDGASSELGMAPTVAIETNSMHLQKRLVSAGCGWTVLPAAGLVEDVASGLLTGAPLAEPSSTRCVVLGLPRNRRQQAVSSLIAAELTHLIHRLVVSGTWLSASLSDDLLSYPD